MSVQTIDEMPATPAPQVLGHRRARIERRLGLPPRPKTRQMEPDTAWMAGAVCATASEADRLAFVTVERQDDAWPLVEAYCDRCPVAEACREDGRRSHLHGLAGGYVLADGYLAPDAGGDRAFRSPAAWVAPWDRDEADEPATASLAAVPERLEPELAALLVGLAREAGSITSAEAAQALEETTGSRPTTKLARRHLEALEAAGHLVGEPAPADGRRRVGRWTAAVVEELAPPRRHGQRWQPKRHRRARRRGRR